MHIFYMSTYMYDMDMDIYDIDMHIIYAYLLYLRYHFSYVIFGYIFLFILWMRTKFLYINLMEHYKL